QAVERGHEVVQIERETEARGASLRNFGQIWVPAFVESAVTPSKSRRPVRSHVVPAGPAARFC
ncbi:hypothetical protein ABZX34_35765, partial [Streptomyces sp. NPDC004362]|uniref:hypothetical protein n=1 Tax=Streptomyces sp. NPDC004362 TaxID=3154456 RepID=UPI0033BA455D